MNTKMLVIRIGNQLIIQSNVKYIAMLNVLWFQPFKTFYVSYFTEKNKYVHTFI